MQAPSSIITLTTDFGLDDFFVGAMKGVILTINPLATIIDITHTIQPHDIRGAAFTLAHACREFPPGTIHLVVVDPGVGSARHPILVTTSRYALVGPDNGVFSLVYLEDDVKSVVRITAEHYFLNPVSRTFHGRDIFAPVAAWLSRGVEPDCFGSPITELVKFDLPRPALISPAHIRGQVIHIDRFGNLITNFTRDELPPEAIPEGVTLVINNRSITRFQSHFAQAPPGEAFAVLGSTGRWEIAVYQGSAEKALNAAVGTVIELTRPAALEKE